MGNVIASPETLELESISKTTEDKLALTSDSKPADQPQQDAVSENLYLVGRPTLKQFIHYVRGHAVNQPSKGTLTDEWQAAHTVVRTLEKEEAGLADNPPIRTMGMEYESFLVEFLKDPLVRYNFNTVPTEVAFVELDRLVVYQKHIDLNFARQLESKLGPAPTEEQILKTCLPYDHPQPPVKWTRVRHGKYVFMSVSNDMRFLGAMPLHSGNIKDYPPPGNLVGVVGIAVGFGSNFLNAIYVENRLILNNGSHRAYALRKMGITHVPCIVQHLSSRDELDLVGSSEIRRDPDFYLKHPRPSMLKDYFNPKLQKLMPVRRRLRQITVRFEVEEHSVPAL
jgi:hypothetical protein